MCIVCTAQINKWTVNKEVNLEREGTTCTRQIDFNIQSNTVISAVDKEEICKIKIRI